ncbi:MAG: D-alanyl-D-alanine carboxypeptidase [Desulfobulbaceae bacterium]|uniref:D-alanyl-D-alanine carboxypeptidase n=1 Tax=Candidatus Desulfobia pelagia TaxID=2841692 RepID=A0A8J6NFF5_9BACT|nr:D-alanyl-D-alanine carboxypeptidase [Candidatus Desulfobia pelagia]
MMLLLFLLPFFTAIQPVQAKKSSHSSIIATTHKCAPGKEEKTEKTVTRSVSNTQTLITSSPSIKRKPARQRVSLPSVAKLRKKLSSRSALVMDSRTGEILYAHDPDRPAQPASTIKVLTGLLSIQALQNKEYVFASKNAARMPRSKIDLKQGKSYRANDLINAVLLASANDASVALAEKVAGSEKNFAQLMTNKARELGAGNTVCKTASGLTARGQKSTARDLAIIFNKAMTNREFAARIAKTKTQTSYGKTLRNHNKALWRIKGAMGGKTGYTSAARQTYVGKFGRDDDELVVAIMGSETMWDDISRLVEYGFAKQQRLASARPAMQKDTHDDTAAAIAKLTSELHQEPLQVLAGVKKYSKLQ